MVLPALSTLVGEKVKLRPFTISDIGDRYISWLNDPQVVRYSNQRFHKHDQISCINYLNSFSETNNFFIAITDKKNDLLLGTVTAYIASNHGTVDVGIMVGERSIWHQGTGQDAWNTICYWLLSKEVGLRKLTAGTARPNVGMVRIMERFGMQLEAVRSKQEIIEDIPTDILHYARFAHDA